MKTGDTVRYSKPEHGEEDLRFILRETNGDRVLIELVCNYAIKPLETIALSEICAS